MSRLPNLPSIFPRLNHGRWIVDCPSCPSAELLDSVSGNRPKWEGLVFLCSECGDVEAGRGLGKIVRDVPGEREVWRRVNHRPLGAQSWDRSETLADLELENRMHGYPSESGALIATPDGLVERI